MHFGIQNNIGDNRTPTDAPLMHLHWARLDATDENKHIFVIWSTKTSGRAILYAPLADKVHLIDGFYESLLLHKDMGEYLIDLMGDQFVNGEALVRNMWSTQSTHFAIGLSQRCNLNCVYCHSDSTGPKKTTILDISQLDIICREIISRIQGHKKALVSFACGGEPTIEWHKLQYVVETLKQQSKYLDTSLSFSMTTNGIYGDRKRQYIVENFSSITLSVDGIPKIHDAQRPTIGGKGSFCTVWETARYFRQARLPFGIRSTVCREGLGTLTDFVRMVSDEFSPIILAFEALVPIGRGAKLQAETVGLSEFCDAFWEARRVGQALNVDVRTSALNLKRILPTMCGAMAVPSITFTPDGNITACHRDINCRFKYGDIDVTSGEIRFDAERCETVRAEAVPPAKCEGCFCRWTCGGDCPDARDAYSRCAAIRELTYRGLMEKLHPS